MRPLAEGGEECKLYRVVIGSGDAGVVRRIIVVVDCCGRAVTLDRREGGARPAASRADRGLERPPRALSGHRDRGPSQAGSWRCVAGGRGGGGALNLACQQASHAGQPGFRSRADWAHQQTLYTVFRSSVTQDRGPGRRGVCRRQAAVVARAIGAGCGGGQTSRVAAGGLPRRARCADSSA
jgi:hypothetical protein